MIKIPYKLVNGIMLIPATANDKEGFFAFDTGAMQTAINKAYFQEKGRSTDKERNGKSNKSKSKRDCDTAFASD